MKRVKKGEIYWYVRIAFGIIEVSSLKELEQSDDDSFFAAGNYFHTKEEAETMAEKLRAVLKGAEVIEMPSEEDMENEALENNWIHKERGDCNYPDDLCVEFFKDCAEWLKSKCIR